MAAGKTCLIKSLILWVPTTDCCHGDNHQTSYPRQASVTVVRCPQCQVTEVCWALAAWCYEPLPGLPFAGKEVTVAWQGAPDTEQWGEELLMSADSLDLINALPRHLACSKTDLLSEFCNGQAINIYCYRWHPDTQADTWLTKDWRRVSWGQLEDGSWILGQDGLVAISKECTRQPWNYWNIQTMTNTTK